MSDYTPTTEEIQSRYVYAADFTVNEEVDAWGEFDRWLAAHDTEVYKRGREDEKAVWINPCWQCGMNADSVYICDDCIADARGGEQSE